MYLQAAHLCLSFCHSCSFSQELVEALHEYLSHKGVDDDFCEKLLAFTSDKEYGEYLRWLEDAQNFLK